MAIIAADNVVVIEPAEQVISKSTVQAVISLISVDDIIVFSTVNCVVSCLASDKVVASIARDVVVSGSSIDMISGASACQNVVIGSTEYEVGLITAVNFIFAGPSKKRVFSCATRDGVRTSSQFNPDGSIQSACVNALSCIGTEYQFD